MNKRVPLLLSLLALAALVASLAYWVLQLVQPQQRPLAPMASVNQAPPSIDAAATLFGGEAAQQSNFQLTGVVAAGPASAAILVADGEPPKAVRVGREVVPGVVVHEVHKRYVMLSDGGVLKRVDLAVDTGPSSTAGADIAHARLAAPQNQALPMVAPPPQPQQVQEQVQEPPPVDPTLQPPPTDQEPQPQYPQPEPQPQPQGQPQAQPQVRP